MKLTKITLSIALLGALTFGMADETTQTNTNEQTQPTTQQTIDAKIAKIQNASAQERVQLMNEFKQQLAKMNQQDRMEAISQMQEKMHATMQENMQNGQEEAHSHYNEAKEMMQEKQAQAMDHMNQAQQMNQAQAGNQMEHMMEHVQQGSQNNPMRQQH